MQELNVKDKFLAVSDGKQALEILEQMLDSVLKTFVSNNSPQVYQPVSILMLDIVMPIVDGLETVI